MKKQTAVDWLIQQINEKHSFLFSELAKEAKEIEKERSLDAFFAGYSYEGGHPIDEHNEFYTETYTDK